MAGVPYTFANATTSIPLSQLDANFNTTLTLGNTSVGLGNTVTTIGNLTLTNVTISSGTIPTANSIANGTSNVVIASSGGAINIATNGTTAVTIDTSQKVGIGTTSPSSILNVSQSSAADAVIRLNNTNGGVYAANLNIDSSNQTGSRYSSLYSSYGGTYQWSISGGGADSTMAFGTGSSNTERMRISSSGQLIIGRTSAVNAAPLIPSTTQNSRFVSFVNNTVAAEVGYIFCNNDNSTTQYATTSDYRLKTNVQSMVGALDKVLQLKPCTYTWKETNANGQGFIAHELQAVVPDCVTGEKDAVDAEGKPVYQGIDTSFLVATLTAAIQELNAKVEAQAATITQQSADIAALKAKVGA